MKGALNVAKNVLIPLSLLERIAELLGYWDTSIYDRTVRDDYEGILRELNAKMLKLELRVTYTKIIRAKDDDARHSARMDYLWQRNQIRIVCGGDTDS